MDYAKKLGRDGYSQYLFDLSSELSSIMPDIRTIFVDLLKFPTPSICSRADVSSH